MIAEAEQIDLFYRFAAALLIGLLVGLQRAYADLQQEPAEKSFGGVRTFALLGLLGCTAAFLAEQVQSALVFVAIVAILGGIIMVAYFLTARTGSIGMTTDIAQQICFVRPIPGAHPSRGHPAGVQNRSRRFCHEGFSD